LLFQVDVTITEKNNQIFVLNTLLEARTLQNSKLESELRNQKLRADQDKQDYLEHISAAKKFCLDMHQKFADLEKQFLNKK
jgi:hypothetical protein